MEIGILVIKRIDLYNKNRMSWKIQGQFGEKLEGEVSVAYPTSSPLTIILDRCK